MPIAAPMTAMAAAMKKELKKLENRYFLDAYDEFVEEQFLVGRCAVFVEKELSGRGRVGFSRCAHQPGDVVGRGVCQCLRPLVAETGHDVFPETGSPGFQLEKLGTAPFGDGEELLRVKRQTADGLRLRLADDPPEIVAVFAPLFQDLQPAEPGGLQCGLPVFCHGDGKGFGHSLTERGG